jgi:TPR repeat protein
MTLVVSLTAAMQAGAGIPASDIARAEGRLAERFASRGIDYPPANVTLVALKREARLEVWAGTRERWTFVRSYLIRAASGRLGPKLREGDHQVPEGVYDVTALNPSSNYHLSLRLGYPNEFETARGAEDERARLGGDIMIHGGAVSDGCLALGDPAIEEIFALAERVGIERMRVIVSPLDLRRTDLRQAQALAGSRPRWLGALYASIASGLAPFALPADIVPAVARAPRRKGGGCKPWDRADCGTRCGMNDAASCTRAGMMRAAGSSGPEADRAWLLLRRGCEGGDMLGCAELARMYVEDDGPRRDAARAAVLAEAACERGNGHGCAVLARLCSDHLIYPERADGCSSARVAELRESAVARLRYDCAGWNARDCATLATIYDPDDTPTALRFARGACDGGDPRGCALLAALRREPATSATVIATH